MSVKIYGVPCVIKEYSGRKETGEAHTVKKLLVDVNLGARSDIVEALSSGVRPPFKGLDLLEQGAADGGGPYDLTLSRKLGPLAVTIYQSVPNGDGSSKPGKKVIAVENAKLQGKWKIHLGANMSTMTSSLKFVGGVASEALPNIDAHTGCDLFLDLVTLQTDAEELAAASKAGGSVTDKGTKKMQLDIEDAPDAADDDDGIESP